MLTHHAALIYTMVLISASDREMSDAEMEQIGEITGYWPVFRDFDRSTLGDTATECAEMLNQEDGFARTVDAIAEALPERLRETAYALACDVAAADGSVAQEELRLLELLRHKLDVGRLEAAAIERGTRARHMT